MQQINRQTELKIFMIVLLQIYQRFIFMQTDIHTIVIGSGISGMGAASQLAKNGFKVLVLECNNYIGGRTSTAQVKLANQTIFPFDLGASWIHRSQGKHPITKLSKEMGNVKLLFTDNDSIVFYDQNGKSVDDQVEQQFKNYEDLMERIEEIEGLSVYDAIQKLDPRRLSNKYFMYNISYDVQFESSSPIQDLSASRWNQDSQFGGKEMIVVTGYQQFPEYLSHNPNIKVLTNHQVLEVTSMGSNNIVKCSNGQSFQATNVLISVPIGALKSKNIRFNPQLPPWKHESIQKIHFGNVCKILIVLKNKSVNREQTYIGVVLDDIQKRGCANFFLNLEALAKVPALMTFGLGANAQDLQRMPENQLKELIASRLRVFSDKSFGPNDFDIVRTSWRSNPNFRGTYSYAGVQTTPEHWKNMAKPIFERNMYFCGEHTHSRYRGSVHGAYLSGVEAASYIMDDINEQDWIYKGRQQESGSQSQGQEDQSGQQEQDQEEEQNQQQENQQEQENRPKRNRKQSKDESQGQKDSSQEGKGRRRMKKGRRSTKKGRHHAKKEEIKPNENQQSKGVQGLQAKEKKPKKKERKTAKSPMKSKEHHAASSSQPRVASSQCCQIC